MINEELLQFTWNNKLLALSHFVTLQGNKGRLISPGTMNLDSGADFINARVQIDEITWAGNIEIEVKTSSWFAHGHHKDPSHANTILLVVYENDMPLEKLPRPVLELKERLPETLLQRYELLHQSLSPLHCKNHIHDTDFFLLSSWLERMAVERLEEKYQRTRFILEQNNYNWQQTFYQLLCRNFGFSLNMQPFEQLALTIPYTYFSRNAQTLHHYEAFLFGASGLLSNAKGNYAQELRDAFDFFSRKYNIRPLHAAVWKFSKTRPSNFPTLRIAQLASLLYQCPALFSKCMEATSLRSLYKLFENAVCSTYWFSHYHFHKETINHYTRMGQESIGNICINTVVPVMFAYGKHIDDPQLVQRSLILLQQAPAENNRYTRTFTKYLLPNNDAMQSQGYYGLYHSYCKEKKCLRCSIGLRILKNV